MTVPKKKTVKKAPVKKAPVKKAPVKKAPVKKAPVKKAPVKKAQVSRGNTTSGPTRRGGKTKGITVNRKTQAFFDLFDELKAKHDCDPVEVLFLIVKNKTNEPNIRRLAANDLMSYRYAKLRSTTVTDGQGNNPFAAFAGVLREALDIEDDDG